jgi:hypothetical protein
MATRYGSRFRPGSQVEDWLGERYPSVDDYIDQSGAVTFTCDVAAHTKGAWAELIASTTAESNLLWLKFYLIAISGQATGTLIDIGVGAAGSESVIIGDVAVGSAFLNAPDQAFFVPVNVPAGSRIAVRGQSVRSSQTGTCAVTTVAGPTMPSTVDVLGTSTATSVGTLPGSTGAWNEIVASTSKIYRYIILVPSGSSASASNVSTIMRLGVGAAGSELIILRLAVQSNTGEVFGMQVLAIPNVRLVDGRNYPAGSRFAVSNAGSNSGFGATLIGVPW